MKSSTAKHLVAWKVLVLAFGGCLPFVQAHAEPSADNAAVVLRVDATGADAGKGRVFGSVAAALREAEQLKRRQPLAAVRIEIAAGNYYVDGPLGIGPELSGTDVAPTQIVAASSEAPPHLFAGRKLSPQWKPYRDGIMQAKIEGKAFDQLFLGGKRQVRARYPNFDPKAAVLGGYAADALAPNRVQRWQDPSGAIVQALHSHRWGGMQVPILGKNPDGSLIFGKAVGNNRPSEPHATYRYVENVFEELDAPGEWFLNTSTSTLYFMPPQGADLRQATVVVSGPERLLDIRGRAGAPVHHVRIAGLKLGHTGASFLRSTEQLLRSDWLIAREGAIYLENTEDVTVADNEFTELGGNAVFVSGYNRRAAITGNHIHDIGGSAISFTGLAQAVRSPSFRYEEFVPFEKLDRATGPKTNDYPADARVEDNLIHDIGTIEKQVAGVQISIAMRIKVAHNSIYNVPRAGINIADGTWGGHVIEYNDVFNTVLETGDHGAFNSWGRDRFWHPDRQQMDQINAAHPGLWKLDAIEPVTVRYNRFRCDNGWDIDLDDGSSNYRVHDNLMLNGGLKFREGFDRQAWNNLLVNNGLHPHVWFKDSGDRFEHNIAMAGHQPILMDHWDATIDYNLLPSEQALQQAQALHIDEHSRAGDPKFRDAAKGDFRVAEGSPALAIGFKNFRMDQFGVTSARLKALAKTAPMPELVSAATLASGEARDFLGARVKSVTTLGEQSAAGLPEIKGVLVLSVAPGSLAELSGLRANDVIVEASANEYGAAEDIDSLATLMTLYRAQRWRGEREFSVVRNQQRHDIKMKFVPE